MIKKDTPGYNLAVQENTVSEEPLDWCRSELNRLSMALKQVDPLKAEASHRAFFRIHTSGPTYVLMTSPPDLERNDAFMDIGRLFLTHNVPVPRVHASNMSEGWFLMEDLGTRHLEDTYGTADEDQALAAAIATLQDIQAINDPLIEPYTEDRMRMEVNIFREWFLDAYLGEKTDPRDFDAACQPLIDATQNQPQVCIHRDYHCRNLLFNDGHFGAVDFQDALCGPVLYDIASLLRDCYHKFPEERITHWLDMFVQAQPLLERYTRTEVQTLFDLTALQRQVKAIGIFARLKLRDDKPSHLDNIKPVMTRAHELSTHYPDLHLLTDLLSRTVARL